MAERGIEAKDISRALLKPDWYEPTFGGRMKVQKKLEDRILEIIYIELENTMIVITCYFL